MKRLMPRIFQPAALTAGGKAVVFVAALVVTIGWIGALGIIGLVCLAGLPGAVELYVVLLSARDILYRLATLFYSRIPVIDAFSLWTIKQWGS